ncbi:hypothetical protein X975_23928, partial [Stegodyphus mimosarum]
MMNVCATISLQTYVQLQIKYRSKYTAEWTATEIYCNNLC